MLDLSSLIIYTALVAVGWITYKLYIYPYYISPLRKIPGPPTGNPIYGNIKPIFYEEGGETHFRWIKKYGNIVKYHELFNQPAILVTDAKIIQEIALSNGYDYYKPRGLRGDLESIIGHGIAFAEGEVHKRQRKMMNPAFTHHYIKNMVPTFSRVASTLINLLENKVNKGGSKVILSPYISKATLDVIGLVGFNHEFNSQTSPSDLATAYETIGPQLTDKLYLMIGFFAGFVPFIRQIPIDVNKIFIKVRDVIGSVSVKLIEEKYQEDKYNKLNGTDLLSLLIKINKTLPIEDRLTELELRYQIMTFLFAGHETTSNATSWALYLLAQHPKEQELLREELVKAFPDKSKFNPTFDEINSLEYLNCIIKETLRLYPPVASIRRYNIKDKMFGENLIPKGTTIDIPIVALHRLPSIWGSTADDFDPKRWLNPSSIENITNYNYLPFGTGLRSCIGNKLALSEFKILLSMLVRNFSFQPVEGFHVKKEVGILIKPSPYLELTVSKVEV